jgi:two-component system response regulator
MNDNIRILLVEDNFEHLRLTRYILQRNNVPGDVYVVRDGQEAIDFLYQRNNFSNADQCPRPHLILLDLNIPRIDGKEVLRTIKSDKSLADIPVVVVSSSDREEDINYAYEKGASAYISKSGGFEHLNKALAVIHTFAAKGKQ